MTFVYQPFSSISIRHNSKFALADVESVLAPLFGDHYGLEQLRSIIDSVDHIWCVFDRRTQQYVACALVHSHEDKNALYVKLFGVAPDFQGQGLGTRLLKTVRKWATRENYSAMILHTQINNYRAINLYEKVGFRKQFLLEDFFRPPGTPSFAQLHESDAYQMILYL